MFSKLAFAIATIAMGVAVSATDNNCGTGTIQCCTYCFLCRCQHWFTDTCLNFQAVLPRKLVPCWLPSLMPVVSLALQLSLPLSLASLALLSPAFLPLAPPGICPLSLRGLSRT